MVSAIEWKRGSSQGHEGRREPKQGHHPSKQHCYGVVWRPFSFAIKSLPTLSPNLQVSETYKFDNYLTAFLP